MSLWTDLTGRLRALLLFERQERELDEELQFHIDQEIAERIRAGAEPAEARRAALASLGGVEALKEGVRDARGVRPLQDLLADLRYTLRSLRRDPQFAAAAILVLAVGLGATATVFATADAVLFRSLPYHEAERLVRVGQRFEPSGEVWQLSVVDAQAILERQRSFEAFGLVHWTAIGIAGGGPPEQIAAGRVTSGFFEALQIGPAAGRLITPDDETASAAPVVVLSHGLASRRFGSASAALGQSLLLDGVSHVVIGVLLPGVQVLGPGIRADAWPVLRLRTPERRGPFFLRGVGRLRNGTTLEGAARDLAGISAEIFPIWASGFPNEVARLAPVPLRDSVVGRARRSIGLFAVAVLLTLLVTIVNVTTLAQVRASAREAELGVRSALGAGRLRLVRLPLAEGMVLGLVSGIVGAALTALGVHLVTRFSAALPRVDEVGLSLRTVGYTVVTGIVAGVCISALPMLGAWRSAARTARLGESHRAGVSRRTGRLRGALVAVEFTLALPLLLGASLLFRSFMQLQRVDPGFDPEGVMTLTVVLPAARYPGSAEQQPFWRELEQQARDDPGIVSAGISTELPVAGAGNINNFNLIDRPVPSGESEHVVPWVIASPGYFEALGIRLLEGRSLSESDSASAPPVIVVSRTWAQRYYPGESAVGRQLIEGGCTSCPPTTVVGVVEDVKYEGLDQPADAAYAPLTQASPRGARLVVRSRLTPAETFGHLRRVVGALDPELPATEQTMSALIDGVLSAPGRSTAILSGFAVLTLALAALGIFGMVSYSVRQRRREIGVRIALGADPAGIRRLVVAEGLRYAALGAVLGLGLALVEAWWLQDYLYEVAAINPLVMLESVGVLLLVAAAACWIPGARAARVDPVQAIATQ